MEKRIVGLKETKIKSGWGLQQKHSSDRGAASVCSPNQKENISFPSPVAKELRVFLPSLNSSGIFVKVFPINLKMNQICDENLLMVWFRSSLKPLQRVSYDSFIGEWISFGFDLLLQKKSFMNVIEESVNAYKIIMSTLSKIWIFRKLHDLKLILKERRNLC